jgi:hypothetical protein
VLARRLPWAQIEANLAPVFVHRNRSGTVVEGFNLFGPTRALIFGAIAYLAMRVGDTFVLSMALACLGAILGFFVFTYPAGLIFLGDGGAYLLGFMMAELALPVVHRNEAVSPMFALLVCIFPIFETGFSMYRRKVVRQLPSMVADGIHLHSLIYRRVMRWAAGDRTPRAMTRRNSMTPPYLWALCTLSVVPAVLFWSHTGLLLIFLLLFGMTLWPFMPTSCASRRRNGWCFVGGGSPADRSGPVDGLVGHQVAFFSPGLTLFWSRPPSP